MPRPEFTNDEQYLLSFVQTTHSVHQNNPFMWSYLLSGLLLAGFAAYNESTLMLLSAFLVVCGFRVYEEQSQARWIPIWRSIIEKYENATVQR
jgi:hypothetical protein